MPTAKKKAEPKDTPSKPEIEGFRVIDYEGLDSLECTRPKCGFQTFDVGSAKAHTNAHEADDDAGDVLAELKANLSKRAQVSTDDDGGYG